MEKETLIKDISVEWNGGKVRGFRSKQEAERFINRICKKTAPNIKYSIYKFMTSSSSKKYRDSR
ncbi:hypothetical protein [Candidatus Methanoperedens nitratireducens]|uniref:hypothetical protein n=1 Tax=Candidatus Methanoperedens nitratireducens TaxID=1392998 RepID=UPI000BB6EC62|nr:hypothetical protein [Candidatus Methanoperedens nitroreducens]